MPLTGNTFYFPWEVSVLTWLQQNLPEPVIRALSGLSMLSGELALVLLTGFLYWCYDKEMGRRVGLNLLMAMCWNPMVKNLALRRRPYMDLTSVRCLRPVAPGADIGNIVEQGYSFPSGHSTNAAGCYGSLAAQARKKWITVLAAIICLTVGLFRVVAGVHYPTDVLGGWLLGAASCCAVGLLRKRIKSDTVFYALLLLSVAPGFFYCRSADYYEAVGLLIGFILAIPFEKRFVRFEGTRSVIGCVIRLLIGGALFFGLNTLIKMPFSDEFLSGGSYLSLLVRSARYMIIIFAEFALYPLIFRFLPGRKGA